MALSSFFLVIVPTFLPISHQFVARGGGFLFNLIFFVYIYILMDFLLERKDILNKISTGVKPWIIFMLNYLIVFSLHYVANKAITNPESSFYEFRSWYWDNYNTLFALLSAIGMFLIFSSNKVIIKHSKFINVIGSSTFAVYLIHQNPVFYPCLWKALDKIGIKITSFFLLHLLIIVLIVFCVALICDFIIGKICRWMLESETCKRVMRKLDSIYL